MNEAQETLDWMQEDMNQDRTLDQMLQPHTETILRALRITAMIDSGELENEAATEWITNEVMFDLGVDHGNNAVLQKLKEIK